MQLSVIVPVFNEAAIWPTLAAHLYSLQSPVTEVIVVDGGSTDGTPELIRAAGLPWMLSAPGRAAQMNAGAARAKGRVVLFLHADTQLPDNALQDIDRSLGSARCWGRFDVRIAGAHPMLRVVAACMNLRSRLSGIATGDQAIFMTREAFHAVGGFPAQPLMEDIEISRRLLALSRPICLRGRVTTSGRRWDERGLWRTIALMWRLRFDYWRGHSAHDLAQRYR